MCWTEKAGTTCSGLALCRSSSWAPPTCLQQLGRRVTRGAVGNAPPAPRCPSPTRGLPSGPHSPCPPHQHLHLCGARSHSTCYASPPAHGVPWKPPAAAAISPTPGLPLFRGPGPHASRASRTWPGQEQHHPVLHAALCPANVIRVFSRNSGVPGLVLPEGWRQSKRGQLRHTGVQGEPDPRRGLAGIHVHVVTPAQRGPPRRVLPARQGDVRTLRSWVPGCWGTGGSPQGDSCVDGVEAWVLGKAGAHLELAEPRGAGHADG